MYWRISPYHDLSEADECVMPADTEANHRSALEYAQKRLEAGWDATAHGKRTVTVTMELCDGDMPEEEDL